MWKAIGCVLIVLTLLVAAKAQSSTEPTILEVHTNGVGMVRADLGGSLSGLIHPA